MNKRCFASLAALSLVANATPGTATDLVASPLAGSTWQVVAIDGQAVEPPHSDDERARLPAFTFGYRSYGGNAGCNALGGLYAQVDARFYTMPGAQTAMACGGARGAQENAANAIFDASPTVTRAGDTAELAGGGHTMSLRLIGAAGVDDPPAAWQAPGLEGQSYAVHAVNGLRTDGKRLFGKTPPRMRFAKGKATSRLDCAGEMTGFFLQSTEHLHAAFFPPVCSRPDARDAAFAQIIGADPRVVSGPNGELLLASRKGWAILWNERRDRPK